MDNTHMSDGTDALLVVEVPVVEKYEQPETEEVVYVCGMMHLLPCQGESGNSLHQTLRDVYYNFTLIHNVACDLLYNLQTKFPDNRKYVELRKEIGFLITFCRCSLKVIFKEDGITINQIFADLLAETEVKLLDLIKYCNDQLSSSKDRPQTGVQFVSKIDMLQRIAHAYFYEAKSFCQPLITYDLTLEFLDQLIEDLDNLNESIYMRGKYLVNARKRLIVLKNYLELLTMYSKDIGSLLSSIEPLAFEVARHCFLDKMCGNVLNHQLYKIGNIDSRFRVEILTALTFQPRTPLMSDELLTGYVMCIQEYILELLKDEVIGLTCLVKDPFKILHEAFSLVMPLLIRYQRHKQTNEQNTFSDIRVNFQACVRDVGFCVCSCFSSPTKGLGEMRRRLYNLIEKVDVFNEEIIRSIWRMVLKRAGGESPRTVQLILVLRRLKELMDHKPDLLVSWKDHENLFLFLFYLQNNITTDDNGLANVEELDDCEMEKVCFLTEYLQLVGNQLNHEELNELLTSAQVVAFKVACYSLLKRCGKFHWWEIYLENKGSVDLHVRIGILKALVLSCITPLKDELLIAYVECVQDNIMELLRDEVFNPLKDQFKILHDGVLLLLRLLISYSDEQEKLSQVKVGFLDLVKSLGTVIYWCFRVKGDTTEEQSVELSNVVEKLNLVKVETKKILPIVILNKIGCKSPKTDQLGSLSSLLRDWNELMERESDLIISWKGQSEMIHESLVLFRSFITKHTNEVESQDLCNRILDAGYVAEYLLNSFSDENQIVWCTSLWISEFMGSIEVIKALVVEANEKKGNITEVSIAGKGQSHVSSQPLLVPSTDEVVGFDVEIKLILEQLIGDFKKLDVISIVGMPGLGKTTLARKVYEDPLSVSHFEIRVWCCVSQEYNRKELFLTILGSIIEITDLTRRKSEEDISLMVHQELMGRRYLIVLDDIWEIDAFTELRLFFPDDSEGSRIMLTSRSKVIGTQAKHHSDPIEPVMLTNEESWDLLERKIYHEGKCPTELSEIGKEIAKRCRGLPLAVVLVGGLLSKSTRTREFWEQVSGNLTSYLARDAQSQVMAALELSYKFLPDFLKPLFLYLGVFPEDNEICTDKLILLWIAEGFVHENEITSLEIQAETCLMELIDRSLVMVAKRRSNGRVKACHVHDLLRDMCLKKSKKENFMRQVNASNELPDCIMYDRRLNILIEKNNETSSRHFAAYQDLPMLSITPPIYSLLFFYLKPSDLLPEEDIKKVFSSLKLLRVLHADSVTITSEDVFQALTTIVCLRYVAVRASLNNLPPSISRLRSLESLIIKGLKGEIIVPDTIWMMTKLRHIHINARAMFSVPPDNCFILERLQTLSTPVIGLGEEESFIRKVPGLKKLRCIFTDGTDYDHRIPNLESLKNLETLKMLYYGGMKCSGRFNLPLTIKKLSISKFRLKWSEISVFQELRNLEILKLRSGAVQDEIWEMVEGDEFSSLLLLKFENLNIKKWRAQAENFPSLKKVVLESCKQLEEIPTGLGEFDSLEKIEVIWCSRDAAKMAKQIREEQADGGNEMLKVHIFPPPQVD